MPLRRRCMSARKPAAPRAKKTPAQRAGRTPPRGAAVDLRAATLRQEIERHNRLYYQDTAPEISDQEFDALLRELVDLEAAYPALRTPDSPTRRVGGTPDRAFPTIRHAAPMLSLDNTYDLDEVRAFHA